MDYKFFLKGIKNIIFNQTNAWETASSDNFSVRLLKGSLLFPLVIIISVAAFTGSLIFTNPELSAAYSVFVAIKCFILFYVTVYASSFLLSEITYPLDLGKDFKLSFTIVVYSITPFLLCQVVSRLLESMLFINILGLYGLYIFWTGAEKLLNPPQHKKMPLLIAASVSTIGIYVATNLILTMLIDRIYFAYFT